MKLPPKGSKALQIIEIIYSFGSPMTAELICESGRGLSRGNVYTLASEYGLLVDGRGAYSLPDHIAKMLDYMTPRAPQQPAEIVPPRVVDVMHRKPWSCNLNPAGNRPDTGPVHDIKHYSSGTSAEPFRGVTL